MYGRVIYFFAREKEIGLYVANVMNYGALLLLTESGFISIAGLRPIFNEKKSPPKGST